MATNTDAPNAPRVERLDSALKLLGGIGLAIAVVLTLAVAALALPVGTLSGPVVATAVFTALLVVLAVGVARQFPARPH